MPTQPEPPEDLYIRDDDEGLFSRDFDGQLVRLDAPTESDYSKKVTLQIDGQPVTVFLAEPLTDANGNIVLDLEGRTTPRYTTIYDAARRLYAQQIGDEAKIPIPVLCHQPHMKPVAVCRLCVVQIYGQKRGKRAAERKLLPACQHQVKDGMEVFTMNAPGKDGDRVRQTVKVLTEMLASDHLPPPPDSKSGRELAQVNELGQLLNRCGGESSRFQKPTLKAARPVADPKVARRTSDASSPVFAVDHSACVLCDRCVRACDEVMENHVLGRTGKGATAGIAFDLNDPMGESSCVKCGECMVSCPTGAITFKPVAQIKVSHSSAEAVPASELLSDPLFAGVPPKFLLWQQGLVLRRKVKAGQVLCRQGDAGNTAFLIKSGRYEVAVYPKKASRLGGRGTPVFRGELTPADMIVGEMSCMSAQPRAADVVALETGEVWEVRRNVLDRLMRLPNQRQRFEAEYRERSLDLVLRASPLFRDLPQKEYSEVVNFLRERLSFVRVKAGQTLFKQGDPANAMFLVRLGHVRVSLGFHGEESKVISCGPGAVLGEIGLLAFASEDLAKSADALDQELQQALQAAGSQLAESFPAGVRSATCTALGLVELARLNRGDFLEMLARFSALRKSLVQISLGRMKATAIGDPFVTEFIAQGLYEGRSVLTLDLDLCTRCDECTKGCVEQHGTHSHGTPITRLLRDGKRYDKFLVATSCRSCTDAHCMVGCPVDAIHRGRHQQIVIEDHCIGCGLCASNCPYGSIFMVPNQHRKIEVSDPSRPGHSIKVPQLRAAACDLCDAEGEKSTPEPRCVSACPHDAAHRMSGDELLALVTAKHKPLG